MPSSRGTRLRSFAAWIWGSVPPVGRLLLVLGLCWACFSARGCLDDWKARRDSEAHAAEMKAVEDKLREAEKQVAAREGKVEGLLEGLDRLDQQAQRQDRLIADLAGQAEVQDEKVRTSGAKVQAVRGGKFDRSADDAERARRLRSLGYGSAP